MKQAFEILLDRIDAIRWKNEGALLFLAHEGAADKDRQRIESLASGSGSTERLSSTEEWRTVYYDPVRLFKQSHSHGEVQRIASQLGIKGMGQMSEDELIPEILLIVPKLPVNPEE